MLDPVLAIFPPHTHPLTLASDPDGVLADVELRAALSERGFRLIEEADPIALRAQMQQAQPFTATSPVVVVTRGPLNALPYDLWQQGRRVALELGALFPGLDIGILRTLSPSQRWRLREVREVREVRGPASAADGQRLSRRETVDYALERVFGFTGGDVLMPAGLLTWLARYHAAGDPMPPELAAEVQAHLHRAPRLRGWPLHELLTDAAAYRRFVQRGWEAYLGARSAAPTANELIEPGVPYETR